MAIQQIREPIPTWTDTDGTPLESGYIYIGVAGLNPITSPLQAYWDIGLTAPATGIRTTNGYPSNNGQPGRLYVDDAYSILVKNKYGQVIYSLLETNDILFDTLIIADELAVQGIPEWNSTRRYLLDESFAQNQGIVWKSLAGTEVSPNVGQEPYLNQDKWVVMSADTVLLSAVDGDSLLTQYNHIEVIVDVTAAAAEIISLGTAAFEGQRIKVIANGAFTLTLPGSITIIGDTGVVNFTSINGSWVSDN